METSLYGDQDYTVYRPPLMDNAQHMKRRRLTLDLELDSPPGKRQRTQPLLTSPDLNMLKLASPELERYITQHGLPTTPTPGAQAVSSVFSISSRTVTEEQERYARGFVDALHHLKQQEHELGQDYTAYAAEAAYPAGDASPVYTQLESSAAGALAVGSTTACSLPGQQFYGLSAGLPSGLPAVHIKEEPQTVPSVSSQPPSPVNMQEQERIKLERKRLRNRIAATKCRKRKLERIARLEERVQQIKSDNSELAAVAARLRDQVASLKKEVQQHAQHGCQILPPR